MGTRGEGKPGRPAGAVQPGADSPSFAIGEDSTLRSIEPTKVARQCVIGLNFLLNFQLAKADNDRHLSRLLHNSYVVVLLNFQ